MSGVSWIYNMKLFYFCSLHPLTKKKSMLEVGGILVFTSCHATASIWPHVSSHCCRVMWMVRSLVERKTGSEVSICIFNTYNQCHLAPLYSSVGRHGRPSPQTGTHFRSGVSNARFGPALQSGPLRSSWKLDLGLLLFFSTDYAFISSTSRWVQDFIRKLRRAVDVALLSLWWSQQKRITVVSDQIS